MNKLYNRVVICFISLTGFWLYSHLKLHHKLEEAHDLQNMLLSSYMSNTEVRKPINNLAYEHSGGFFDDINDKDWKLKQKITMKTFPNHHTSDLLRASNKITDFGKYDKLKSSNKWNAENFQEEFHCQFARRLPSDSSGDGPKWVCDPHRITKSNKPCLIYSVGSNGKVEFEQAVKEEIRSDCEIHTFDLVSWNKRNGHFEEALRPYAAFHNWGLSTQQDSDKSEKFKTLKETIQELHHANRQIDLFKIDCEWCEWHTYQDWIDIAQELNVTLKQILVETHNAPMPEAKNFFYSLHNAGYVIFSKEANYVNQAGGVEFGFLKLSPEFFNGNLYKL